MGVVDIIILVIITGCFIKGCSSGLIIELGHIIGIVLGLYVALNFAETTLDWTGISGKYRHEIAFGITLIAVVICVAILGNILTKFVDIINLSIINRLFGGVLNVITAIVILSLLLNIFESFNSKSDLFDKSIFQSYICQTLLEISEIIFPYISEISNSTREFTNDIINI